MFSLAGPCLSGQETEKVIQAYRKCMARETREWMTNMDEKQSERQEKRIYSLSSDSTVQRDPSIGKELERWRPLGDFSGRRHWSLGRKSWGAIDARSTGLANELTKMLPSKAVAPCLLLLVASAQPVITFYGTFSSIELPCMVIIWQPHILKLSVLFCATWLSLEIAMCCSQERAAGRIHPSVSLFFSLIFQVHSLSTWLSFSA